jgi:hypothetical protein
VFNVKVYQIHKEFKYYVQYFMGKVLYNVHWHVKVWGECHNDLGRLFLALIMGRNLIFVFKWWSTVASYSTLMEIFQKRPRRSLLAGSSGNWVNAISM